MSERLIVHLTRTTLRLNDGTEAGRVLKYVDADGLADAIASLASPPNGYSGSTRLLVLVEPPLLQRRTLTDLPPVRDAALRELVAHGTARFFRQNGHALLSAATWATEGESAERVARVVAVEEIFADAIVSGAARGGFRLEDIVAADDAAKPLSLLPVAERQKRAARSWRRAAMLTGGAAMLAVVLGCGWLIQVRSERRRVGAELTRLKEPRSALAVRRLAMDSALVAVLAVQSSDGQRNVLVSQLYAAVRALPDSSYLTSLTLDRIGTGTVEGRAMQAGEMETRFNAVRAFAPVRLSGSGARNSIAGHVWEQFTLGLGSEDSE